MISGDSAGGGLSLATLLRLRDAGAHLPRAAVLISPWVDLSCSGATIDDPVGAVMQFVADDSIEMENLLVKHNTKLDYDFSTIKKRDIDNVRKLIAEALETA